MSETKNAIALALKAYAQKFASAGAPDRMTTADGQGGISTSAGSVPKDPGESEVKISQAPDGTANPGVPLNGSPDRMTTADGQGGISTSGGEPKKDPGEDELKTSQAPDGTTRKSAAERVAAIRKAVAAVNPSLVPNTPAPAPQQKSATAAPTGGASNQIELSKDLLAKIASDVLATEEGVNYVHRFYERAAGAEHARTIVKEAMELAAEFDQTEQVKAAAFDDLAEKAYAIHSQLSAQGVTEADADMILKQAAEHQAAIMELDHPMLKAAYAQGMDDAALLEAADEGGEGMPPVEEALPMGGETPSEEEILALLEEMIASGAITKEDIDKALAAEAGAPATPEGGAAPPAPEGGEAPPMQ